MEAKSSNNWNVPFTACMASTDVIIFPYVLTTAVLKKEILVFFEQIALGVNSLS
jgi:hypothetical protein